MNKKVKEACEESDCKDKKKESESRVDISMHDIEARRERVEKVAKILEGVHYKTESDKAEAIMSFSKANLSYDEIEQLVRPLHPDYMTGQVYKKGVF